MNFTYEQVRDMGFPWPKVIKIGSSIFNRHGMLGTVHSSDLDLLQTLVDNMHYVPTVEEVYTTLRSGLFLKYVHSTENGQCFQFWLTDPGFGDQFYASGRDLCEAVCNAYLRSWCSPKNPHPNQPK